MGHTTCSVSSFLVDSVKITPISIILWHRTAKSSLYSSMTKMGKCRLTWTRMKRIIATRSIRAHSSPNTVTVILLCLYEELAIFNRVRCGMRDKSGSIVPNSLSVAIQSKANNKQTMCSTSMVTTLKTSGRSAASDDCRSIHRRTCQRAQSDSTHDLEHASLPRSTSQCFLVR